MPQNTLAMLVHTLADEMECSAIGGPYTEPPIEHLHVSPFMTRDKSSSDKKTLCHRRLELSQGPVSEYRG